ncbi:MAG: MaoC family dehydratase [Rhizobiaceae bacterium]|nr:MaoC family dehydratase [Rhizobiaceae bacterium]
MKTLTLERYRSKAGSEIGSTGWIDITQERINQFADCTGDHQYIHVDPEKAKNSPFGSTIAHGFLMLALLGEMMNSVPKLLGTELTVNYGMDRVRFVSAVLVNSRVRGRFVLAKFEEPVPGEVHITLNVTIEIEGKDKPALVAVWLLRRYLGGDSSA